MDKYLLKEILQMRTELMLIEAFEKYFEDDYFCIYQNIQSIYTRHEFYKKMYEGCEKCPIKYRNKDDIIKYNKLFADNIYKITIYRNRFQFYNAYTRNYNKLVNIKKIQK